ncbi:MAG: hypothetical protein E7663_00360 [Ruminococcaceae bacterium]|nr:hypothetical protein [Oscillospiraceae bacterium]
MNGTSYEKVYFNDNYKQQFEELRSRYRERTRRALQGRTVDRRPVPNATTIVYLHDDADGNTMITTGDFVEYFNSRYGDKDRIGAMRRSLANAEAKAKKISERAEREKTVRTRDRNKSGFAHRVRSAGRHMALVNAMFLLMLMLSVTMLLGSSLALQRIDGQIAALEAQDKGVVVCENVYNASGSESVSYPALSGGDTVKVFEVEEEQRSGISVLRDMWQLLGEDQKD